MVWYIIALIVLTLIVSELAAEVQILKEQLQDIKKILSKAIERQQQGGVK